MSLAFSAVPAGSGLKLLNTSDHPRRKPPVMVGFVASLSALSFPLTAGVISSRYFKVLQGCLLGGVYVHCIYRMPGGVIVGDSGLCCYGPAFNV